MATLKSFTNTSENGEKDGGEGGSRMMDIASDMSDGDFADDQADLISDAGTSDSVSFQGKRRSALSLKRKICALVTVGILVVAVVVVAVVVGKKDCKHPIDYVIEAPPWDNVRLPTNVVPLSYRVDLHPDLAEFHVHGSSLIELNITSREAKAIVLHAKNMNITSRSLQKVTQGGLQNASLNTSFFYDANDFYVMPVLEPLEIGIYHLQMTFDYILGTGLVGFYRSEYKDGISGKTSVLATTQFEPTDARKAFPCFDEPAMKATFSISLVRDSQHTALSNMDISRNESLPGGLVRVHFSPTVRMSTYLVAFVVSDFDFVQSLTTSSSCPSTKVRVWCRRESISQTSFALQVAAKVLSYYETFYNICYPLQKQDLVAIPDFAAGAMENWGLITYRETALLYDNFSSSTSDQQWVAVVVAHELAHQWFGDLVTMEWWSGLWLNEGFATFMEFIGASHFANNTWDMQLQFVIDDFQRALSADSLASSHPILVEVYSPSEINEIFDSISYSKGGSVLRMLRGVMGHSKFIEGIQHYLRKHIYGNAKTADLWAAMDEVFSQSPTITNFMDTWTLQMGYPLISLRMSDLQVSQQRFLIGGDNGTAESKYRSPFKYVWHVPLTFQTDLETNSQVTFFHDSPTTIRPTKPNFKWMKLNVGQLFYYRVNYDPSNWKLLNEQLVQNYQVFSPADRAGLIDDAFALANDGRVNIGTAMATTSYLHQEDNYVPWSTAISALSHVDTVLSLRPSYGNFQAYYLSKVLAPLKTLGYSDTGSHTQRLLRVALLHKSCDLGDQACISNATTAIRKWMSVGGPSPVPANFRYTYYAAAVANGNEAEWAFFWQVYQNATVAVERRKCLYALAQSQQPWLLKRYLLWSLNGSIIRSQDSTSVIQYVARNPYGRLLAWRFMQENWSTLLARFGKGSFSFSRLILTVTSSFVTPFDLQQVQAFFQANPNAESGQRATQQSLEKIQANINWLSRNEQEITQWMSAQVF